MKILCAGGGTLGSVTPLLAVVEELRLRFPDATVEWWGTANGPEKKLVVAAGIKFHAISAGKLRRYLSWDNFVDLVRIVIGFLQSLWYLGQGKPDCLLTAGSFVAVPVAWAAYLYGVPVFVHQQDIRPSLANRLLSPIAKKITVALADSIKDFPVSKTVMVGNPVRRVFLNPPDKQSARKKLGLDPYRLTLLIMGGGTGAKDLNDLVVWLRPEFSKIAQVIHLTGVGKMQAESSDDYLAMESTNESVVVLAAADLVVTRAGMGSLTELASLSKAAIAVPLPGSHQEINAKYFAERGGVELLSPAELTPAHLLATVSRLLLDNERRINLGKKLNQLLPSAAVPKVADLVIAEINSKSYVST